MAEKLSAKSAWKLNNALKKSAATKPTKVGTARVTRRDSDGSVWVRLPGSNVDTPVNGQILSDAQVGDTVSVRIENGRLSLMGNASTPSVGQQQVNTTVRPVRQTADNALETASTAQTAAELATSYAATAQTAASQATTAAGQAVSAATAAGTAAAQAQQDANSANASAKGALLSLATVEDVVDTLTWITKHGTMALTTDTAVDPSKVYFVPDASGQYVVGGSTYSIVQNPTTEGLSGYYELTIDKSVENYIATHVAVTNEGLWLTPTSSNGYRVLIATGAGTTYTTAGTYIIDNGGNVRAIIGEVITLGNAADGSVVTIDSDSMDMMHGTTEMLHFGYGEGTAASGTANAPYYTIGTRAANSTVGNYSMAEGYGTTASGYASHAEGRETTASSYQSHAEGVYTEASGTASHAEGMYTEASGVGSHAEGSSTHGYKIVASDFGSHAEGDATYGDVTASARAAHAEGSATTASGTASHAEGAQTTASGTNSHAEGQATTASGANSHAGGFQTIAASYNQTALGRYNVADANSTYAIIVGNGTSASARSNALTVDWDGTVDIGPTTVTAEDSGLKVHGSNISTASQTASANLYALIAGMFDKGGNFRSYLKHVDLTNGRQGLQVETRREVNGSNVYNGVQMLVDPSGNRYVVLSDRAAWLSALGYTAPTALPLASGCAAYSSGQTPTYSRDGHVVSVWGAVKPTAEVAAGGTLTIGTLPAGYRPSHDVYVLCQGSGQNKWLLTVSTSGVMTATRYSSGATLVVIPTNAWLPFCATFITTS